MGSFLKKEEVEKASQLRKKAHQIIDQLIIDNLVSIEHIRILKHHFNVTQKQMSEILSKYADDKNPLEELLRD